MGKTAEHGFPRWIKLGSIETRNITEARALVSSQDLVGSSRYDTLERPRGTDYQVPAGKKLYLGKLLGIPVVASTGTCTLDIGYGDDAVANSVSAPTNAKVVVTFTVPGGTDRKIEIDLFGEVPAGKYPYGYGTDASFQFTLLGIEV